MPKVSCLTRGKNRNPSLRRRVPDDLRNAAVNPLLVPERFRRVIGRREVWASLGPISHAQAKKRLVQEMAAVDALFDEARRWLAAQGIAARDAPLVVPTKADLLAVAKHWFFTEESQSLARDADLLAFDDQGQYEEALGNVREDEAALSDAEGGQISNRTLAGILSAYGFAMPAPELSATAARLMQIAHFDLAGRSRARLEGRSAQRQDNPLFAAVRGDGAEPPRPVPATTTIAEKPDALTSEVLLTAWAAETGPSAATLQKYLGAFRQIARILGFDDVRRITPEDVVKFKEGRIAEGRDLGTIADDVIAAGTVCRWAVKNRKLPENPFNDMAPKAIRRGPAPRVPFDNDEAKLILIAARQEEGWLRWAPWLLCFTGARISELAELRRCDVRQEADVMIFDITPTDERAGKNGIFQRMIPLHPALIAEGFLDYVAALPADPKGPLFPSVTASEDGTRATNAQAQHGRWIRGSVGIQDRKKAPAHSWRHRIEDELRRLRPHAHPEAQDAITGRHNPRNAGAGYGKGFRGMPDALLQDLQRIPSPVPPIPQTAQGRGGGLAQGVPKSDTVDVAIATRSEAMTLGSVGLGVSVRPRQRPIRSPNAEPSFTDDEEPPHTVPISIRKAPPSGLGGR